MFQNVYEMMLFTADKVCELESRSAHEKRKGEVRKKTGAGRKKYLSKVV